MNQREMEKISGHFDLYFEQDDCTVLHPVASDGLHVDVLVYEPNGKYPFWKLVTMGASDYKMPDGSNRVSRYNEYIMFVDADENLKDEEVIKWYRNKLVMIASFACQAKKLVTVGHVLDWDKENPAEEMVAAFIDFPQIIEDVGILRCKTGLFKTVACLQAVLLNEAELETLKKIGPYEFSCYLYPEDVDQKQHFLSERHRSGKF